MMQYNQYVSCRSPLSMTFTVAMLEFIRDDVDMMRFLLGYGQ
jgi:hypothetical protein